MLGRSISSFLGHNIETELKQSVIPGFSPRSNHLSHSIAFPIRNVQWTRMYRQFHAITSGNSTHHGRELLVARVEGGSERRAYDEGEGHRRGHPGKFRRTFFCRRVLTDDRRGDRHRLATWGGKCKAGHGAAAIMDRNENIGYKNAFSWVIQRVTPVLLTALKYFSIQVTSREVILVYR